MTSRTHTINKFGDHATCCTKSEGNITQFSSQLDWQYWYWCETCSCSGKGRHFGQHDWSSTRRRLIPRVGLAIDAAVTSPLAPSSLRLTEPCEWYAATKKHAKYDLSFESTHFIFSAMVFETLGAINVEGEEVLRQLFRFAAKRTGREFTSYCGRAWARFSCNLQRSVSQAILTRIDGLEFCDDA